MCNGEHREHGKPTGCNPVKSRPSQTADAGSSRTGGEVFHRAGKRTSFTPKHTRTPYTNSIVTSLHCLTLISDLTLSMLIFGRFDNDRLVIHRLTHDAT